MATQKVNGLQVAAIPTGMSGEELIAALNQRFRQLSLASVSVAAGSSSSSSGSSGSVSVVRTPAVYAITAKAGPSFTPDLSKSPYQQIVLSANATLNGPTGTPVNGATTWTLIIDNPTALQLTVTPDPSKYFLGFQITLDANTRAQITWTNDQNDHNSVAGSSFNGSIPPSS